MALFSIW